jgi:hypothetical protein
MILFDDGFQIARYPWDDKQAAAGKPAPYGGHLDKVLVALLRAMKDATPDDAVGSTFEAAGWDNVVQQNDVYGA